MFDSQSAVQQTRSLFGSDRTPPSGLAAPALQIRVDQYQLGHPRQYGASWLACQLWRSLKLDEFCDGKLGRSREGTDWAALLAVSVA